MKTTYILLIITILFATNNVGFTQNYVCNGETVNIVKPNIRGEYFWQKSFNGQDWTRVGPATGDTLSLIPNETSIYRLEVLEGDCVPIYSAEIKLEYVQIPEISIPVLHEMCKDAASVLLEGASPSGGSFVGPAIVDGRFVPALSDIGENYYHYIFEDLVSGCKDSVRGIIQVIATPDAAIAGSDITLIVEDSIVLDANAPSIGNGQWKIIEGDGGFFTNPNLPNTAFHKGELYGEYVLEWSISGQCGSTTDQVKLQFVETSKNPCEGEPFVWDQDGNRYKTVQIGTQCWMAENIKTGTLVNSTSKTRAHSNHNNDENIEVYGFNNSPDSLALYGGLYDWDEMMGYPDEGGTQTICPDGWHVPTRDEWETLNDSFVDNDAGRQLMPDSTSGFNAYYSGDRHSYGEFVSFGSSGFFWTSSDYRYAGANQGYYYEIVSCSDYLQHGRFSKKTGLSVRCLRDED